ncbi:MAG: TonB-dependent receptor [Rhodocyclaceae bacterium]|nr:TonB-dependent receptor [Rhodocyclaceae bacterium]
MKYSSTLVRSLLIGFFCGLSWASDGFGLAVEGVRESDYFRELPEALTITRLAQPLTETPGAVTVLEQETIRRLPVRNVAELLRFVPGYLVGGYNGAQPVAAYHMPLDFYGARNLVLVDGRPVYSAYNMGDTHRGMLGVLLEDIERIEILRGTNSAAFGANALFGVIHIKTRHAEDTASPLVVIRRGNQGIGDEFFRVGGQKDALSWRLSYGSSADHGYRHAHDDSRLGQLHLRADWRLSPAHELLLQLGGVEQSAGEGMVGREGNPPRTIGWRNAYFNARWQYEIAPHERFDFRLSFEEETFSDAFVYAPDPAVTISSSGKGRRYDLEWQHQFAVNGALRLVWGGGVKGEEALSFPLYARHDAVRSNEARLFGNLEWRASPRWLFNFGAYQGWHKQQGAYLAPRLAANFQATPQHTLRAAVTESWRMPTLFEQMGDVRYYPQKKPPPTNLTTLLAFYGLPYRLLAASGEVRPEKLYVEELGYLGRFFAGRMMLDVRAFRERMRDEIDRTRRYLPGYQLPTNPPTPLPVADFANFPGFSLRGLEWQMRWKISASSELWLDQSLLRLRWQDARADADDNSPPARMTRLVWLQKLDDGLEWTFAYQTRSPMSWGKASEMLPESERFDVRVAKAFQFGSTRGELSATVQAANGAQREALRSYGYFLDRRAYLSLQLGF